MIQKTTINVAWRRNLENTRRQNTVPTDAGRDSLWLIKGKELFGTGTTPPVGSAKETHDIPIHTPLSSSPAFVTK